MRPAPELSIDAGRAHERTLGPAGRRAGGVYYTPPHIVDFVVRETLGRLLRGASPGRVAILKVLDPACGAGAFLVGAYRHLLAWHVDYYAAHDPERLLRTERGWTLAPAERARILLNSIVGVDIDREAVMLTRQALLAECGVAVDLTRTIKRGNFLIGPDWLAAHPDAPADEVDRVCPFDVRAELGEAFDVVLGNPPFIKEYTHRRLFADLRGTEVERYYQGKMDYWYLFACRSLDLLRAGGVHGFLATSNWGTQAGATRLRAKLLGEARLDLFVDFGPFKNFADASVQTMAYVALKTGAPHAGATRVVRVTRDDETAVRRALALAPGHGVECFDAEVVSTGEAFTLVDREDAQLLAKLERRGTWRLGAADIGQGIVAPQETVISRHLPHLPAGLAEGAGIFVLTDAERTALQLGPEEALLRPFFNTEQVRPFRMAREHTRWVLYIDSRRAREMEAFPKLRAHLERFAGINTSAFKPYGLHRARAQRLFDRPKILALRKTATPVFCHADFPCYVSQTFNVIQPVGVDLPGLTALLNSKVVHYWLRQRGKRQGAMLQVDAGPLMAIPLIAEGLEELAALASEATREDLDRAVYGLYRLESAEISRIEESLARGV